MKSETTIRKMEYFRQWLLENGASEQALAGRRWAMSKAIGEVVISAIRKEIQLNKALTPLNGRALLDVIDAQTAEIERLSKLYDELADRTAGEGQKACDFKLATRPIVEAAQAWEPTMLGIDLTPRDCALLKAVRAWQSRFPLSPGE